MGNELAHTDNANGRGNKAQRFREAGIHTSAEVLGAGIEQKLYPFAICIKTDAGNRRFEIYEKLLNEYLKERAED